MKHNRDVVSDCHLCLNCSRTFSSLKGYLQHKLVKYGRHICLGCKETFVGLQNYTQHLEDGCHQRPAKTENELSATVLLSEVAETIKNGQNSEQEIEHAEEHGIKELDDKEGLDDVDDEAGENAMEEDMENVYGHDIKDTGEQKIEYAHATSANPSAKSQVQSSALNMESKYVLNYAEETSEPNGQVSDKISKAVDQENVSLDKEDIADMKYQMQTNLEFTTQNLPVDIISKIQLSITGTCKQTQPGKTGACKQTQPSMTVACKQEHESVDSEDIVIKEEPVDCEEPVKYTDPHTEEGGAWYCHLCEDEFYSESAMDVHKTGAEHTYLLNNCNMKKMLMEDVQKILLNCSPYQCAICHFYCMRSEDIDRHLVTPSHLSKVNASSVPITCDPCGTAISKNWNLRRHMTTSCHIYTIRASGKPCIISQDESRMVKVEDTQEHKDCIKCDKCNVQFNSPAGLETHTRQGQCKIECKLCKIRFPDKAALSEHLKSKLHELKVTAKVKYFCSQCAKGFHEEKHKLMHELGHTHHFTEGSAIKANPLFGIPPKFHDFVRQLYKQNIGRSDKVECPDCKRMITKEYMHSHLRAKEDMRPFQCSLCPKAFTSGANLRTHMKYHLGIKAYQCDKCAEEFNKKHQLDVHMVKVHADEATKNEITNRFICHHCGSGFISLTSLKRHETIHGPRNSKCTYPGCTASFYRKTTLEDHIFRHGTEKNFECDECHWKGKTRDSLFRHKKVHDFKGKAAKKFACQLCEYRCVSNQHLERHMRHHYNNSPYSCLYCDYVCNTFEAVQFHILHSGDHPGMPVYPCKECSYGTDVALDFMDHMRIVHQKSRRKVKSAQKYVGLYDPSRDVKNTLPNITVAPKDTNKNVQPKLPKSTKEMGEEHVGDLDELGSEVNVLSEASNVAISLSVASTATISEAQI